MGNLVAIVGRPNVGKSTLFNRLTKTRQAIVNEQAGTTRDRQYGKSEWQGKEFSVVDTGGWVVNSDDIFEEEIRKQVILAMDEADVILFLVDVKNGVTDLDMDVAAILRRSKKPVIVVANKTDNNAVAEIIVTPIESSAINRSGVDGPINIRTINPKMDNIISINETQINVIMMHRSPLSPFLTFVLMNQFLLQ